jgi:hypothetical protein
MTAAELAAREPALKIARDIYRHANQAGVCYAEIWRTIADAIEQQGGSTPQAPIMRVHVREINGQYFHDTEMLAPGLPDGHFDLYCAPEAVAPYLRASQPGEKHDR